MAKKLRVGILFGGRSGEHEVSLLLAASILKAIDRRKFDVVPIGISKSGHWLTSGAAQGLLEGSGSEAPVLSSRGSPQATPKRARKLRAGEPGATPGARVLAEGQPTRLAPEPAETAATLGGDAALGSQKLDVVFPVLHGTFGEDGTIQIRRA